MLSIGGMLLGPLIFVAGRIAIDTAGHHIVLASLLGLMFVGALFALAVSLSQGERATAYQVVLRHIRTAPLRRVAAGDQRPLPDLGARSAEARRRLTERIGSGFGLDQAGHAMIVAGWLAITIGLHSYLLVEDIASNRYYESRAHSRGSIPTVETQQAQAALESVNAAAKPVMLCVLTVGFGGIGLAIFRGNLRRRRTARRFEALACPDCGYGLAGMPSAIAPDRLGGFFSGPAACPECGSPWPLVPPPTAEEILAARSRRRRRRG